VDQTANNLSTESVPVTSRFEQRGRLAAIEGTGQVPSPFFPRRGLVVGRPAPVAAAVAEAAPAPVAAAVAEAAPAPVAAAVAEAAPAEVEPEATADARSDSEPDERGLGWLPALSIMMALGLLVVALADASAHTAKPWAEPLFWAGLVIMFAPVAIRLLSHACSGTETIWLVVVLGLALYLVKVLYSPLAFNLHDEFLHWRTEIDITNTGHLFTTNPLLPVSALFPALETVTSAVMSATGLPFFYSGVIVIGVARLVLILALYLLYRRVSGSSQVAGVAALLYMGNPNFLFFDAVFSYESLAISFAALFIFTIVRRQGTLSPVRWALTGMAVLSVAALVPTHHLTSYVVCGVLASWTLLDFIRSRIARSRRAKATWNPDARPGPADMAFLAVLFTLLWLVTVAGLTTSYLSPDLIGAVNEMIRLVFRDPNEAGRALFQSSGTGAVTPSWERFVAFASVGILMLGLALGLWWVWKRRKLDGAITYTLTLLALAYPISLPFRLTSRGWEAANRSSEFVYIGLAFVVSLGLSEAWKRRRWGWKTTTILAVAASIVFVGGVIAGWPPEWRLPEPYLIIPTTAGGARTVELKGISAAKWALAYLGRGTNLGADDSNMLLMGTYGDQNIETTLSGGQNVLWVLYSPQITEDQLALLRQGKVQYLVVDGRFTSAPSVAGNYYPGVDIGQALQKFDQLPNVSRVFDDGDIVIYNVGALSRVP
jgi:hypothetical protein